MKKCESCGNGHDGKYGSGRFCSRSCSNFRVHTKETKTKISDTVKSKFKHLDDKVYTSNCERCSNEFILINRYSTTKYCSEECREQSKKEKCSIAGRKSALIQGDNRRSKNEKLFADMCEKYFNDVLTNKPIFNGWDADVIIEDIKVAVLWNGVWHYKKITEKHSVKQVQNRDKIKIKEIKNSGYIPYIIKDMGSYNPEFVKEEFDKFIGDMV